jgi:hypothetical protein
MASLMWHVTLATAVTLLFLGLAAPVRAQEIPAVYGQVLDALGRQGDFKDGVLKVNIPRSDLKVAIDGIATPTPFGFGGWVALTHGTGVDVMMGDLVLTEREVNPVMSALLAEGLAVTAIHNHFFFETPRIFYMHIHGHGSPNELARKLKPALALIGKGSPGAVPAASGKALAGTFDSAALSKIVGAAGETSGTSIRSQSAARTSRWLRWARQSTRAWG